MERLTLWLAAVALKPGPLDKQHCCIYNDTAMAIDDVSQIIANKCIAMRVRLLNRVVTKIYDDCLRSHGLRTAQQNILVAVSLMKLATPSKLEERLSLDKSTVSRNIERMRRRGWIAFVSGKDARSHHLQVTADGMKLLRKTVPAWEKAQKQTVALLGEKGITILFRLEVARDAGRVRGK